MFNKKSFIRDLKEARLKLKIFQLNKKIYQ